ncbi:uncharacterized protein [Acropora muricata]|uniref:uncharacterized protein n=1 Tax=Acropora muricata TaxID=159855 RepID=UPI0034E5F6E5
MLDRAFRLSSNLSYFSEECDWLKMVFSRLDYPDKLVNSTITRCIADKASDQPTSRLPAATNEQDPVRLVLSFKGQASADIVRTQLKDLSQKIHKNIQPVFLSPKLNEDLKVREVKPAIVNQQCLVYKFQCNLCDAGYVGYSRGHLHERVDGHRQKSSSICKHYFSEHNSNVPPYFLEHFHMLTKSSNKFYCLINEMLFYEKT